MTLSVYIITYIAATIWSPVRVQSISMRDVIHLLRLFLGTAWLISAYMNDNVA